MSLGVFIVSTLIFFSLRSYLIKGTSRFMTTFVYFGITVITQYLTNLSAMHVMCNKWQYGIVFFITIIPWVLVFGVITLILIFMPSWLIPFSNTFGFAAAKIAGVKKLLEGIMIDPQQIRSNANAAPNGISENQRKTLDVLYFVTKNPSLIINELTCFASKTKDDPKTGEKITDCKGNFEGSTWGGNIYSRTDGSWVGGYYNTNGHYFYTYDNGGIVHSGKRCYAFSRRDNPHTAGDGAYVEQQVDILGQ